MKQKLCEVNAGAAEKMPEATGDKSGIGVHYVDAYVKPMNAALGDGTAVKIKRRGLKLTLTVGSQKGEAILRRIEHGGDPVKMLAAALGEAARNAGCGLSVEDGAIYLETAG